LFHAVTRNSLLYLVLFDTPEKGTEEAPFQYSDPPGTASTKHRQNLTVPSPSFPKTPPGSESQALSTFSHYLQNGANQSSERPGSKSNSNIRLRFNILIYFQPFLALTKSASSPRAAADLITRATSAPNTFVFAELLSAPQIQALSSSEEYSSHLTLLKIFSYGTYIDYRSTDLLPELNEAQTLKLRQLSFLSLAKKPAGLTYANLLEALGLETPRELEDLVIAAIYAGLVNATLDPYHQLVAVSSVSPLRDLQPNSIPAMITTLNEWSTRCVSTLADLEKQIAKIKAEALKRHKEETEWTAHVEKLMEDNKNKDKEEKSGGVFGGVGRKLGMGAASKRGMDGEDEDNMEVDDEDGDDERQTRSAKKNKAFNKLAGSFGGFGK
jgi:COP9 signalosome complex subunit 7